MRIRETINRSIPLSLAIVLIFLCLNFSFFLLFELLFSLVQFNFSTKSVILSNELILLATLLSNCLSIVLILVFLHFKKQQFSSSPPLANLSVKSTSTFIIVSVAIMTLLKHELMSLWTQILGEIRVDLVPWPFHLFEPEINDISYLIFFTLIFVIIQPYWEEQLFRRILAGHLLKQGFNQVYTVILSSFAYSLFFAFYLLVEISINDLVWFFITTLVGMILGSFYVQTERIRYSYLISSLINLFSLLLFLSKNHFEFIPYREVILVVRLLVILSGLLIISFVIFQMILKGIFKLKIKEFFLSFLVFGWPAEDHLKKYWMTIVFLLPLVPLGVVVFVDHTVLYTDLLALILENGISTLILISFSILLYYCMNTNLSITQKGETETLKLSLSWFSTDYISNKNISIQSILRGIRSRIVFIILTAGVISPFYVLSVVARTKVEIIILWQALVDISIIIVQNPFFTFQYVVTEIRSNIIFIGNKTEILDSFYFLQQSLGKWNFLPDTYMSNSSDWIHGLLTVILWVGIIALYVYLLRKHGQYSLKLALGAVLLIVLNFLWILLAMGFGSISAEGGPLGVPPLEDISLLINFDISIDEFLILPFGLLMFLIALIIFSQFLKRRKDEKLRASIDS